VIVQITDEVHVDEAVGEAPALARPREPIVVAARDDRLQRDGVRPLEDGEVRARRRGPRRVVELISELLATDLSGRSPGGAGDVLFVAAGVPHRLPARHRA